MAKEFTIAELADRWYDKRDVQNLAGKYVTSLLLKREGTIFDTFWSKRDDVCLGFDDGYYVGRDAVSGYYAAAAEYTAKKSQFIKQLFPEKLNGFSDEELFGVGQLKAMPITTPVIELSEDGGTAKGIWHVQGSDNDVTVYGPLSYWTLGFLCVDFIREDDEWKLWHVLYAEDISCPMGENWASPKAHEPMEGFETIGEMKMPAFSVEKKVYERYNSNRDFTAPPRIPEPYATFAETFSYGV